MCGIDLRDLGPYQVHLDHIVPVRRGGAEEDRDNVQLLCRKCNERKGERTGFRSRKTTTPAEARALRARKEARRSLAPRLNLGTGLTIRSLPPRKRPMLGPRYR